MMMMCLDDDDLVFFTQNDLKDPARLQEAEMHIMQCEECFQKYLFLLSLTKKEKEVFASIEKTQYPTPKMDVIVYATSEGPTEPVFVNFSKYLTVFEENLLTRSTEEHFRRALTIQKKAFPTIHLVESEEKEMDWFFYLEEDLSSLEILEGDKILYKSSYEKKNLLTISISTEIYKVRVNNKPVLSFKLIKEV